MKKYLLSLMLLSTIVVVRAQNVVLNELYGNPGGSNSEFIELYNSSSAGSLDCYTIMTYFENEGGTNTGWYVLDLPSTPSIAGSPGFYILAPTTPFSVQGTPGSVADVNWNDATFRSGSTGGYLKKFVWNGSGYNDALLPETTSINNLLDGTLTGSQYYITLLFKNGVLINGFIGGGANGNLSALAVSLGSITVPAPVTGCGGFTFNLSSINAIEYFNPSGGNDNGYARTSDGGCGSWIKTANQVNHTPGTSNGNLSNTGSLAVSVLYPTTITNGTRTLTYSVNSGGPAGAYPVTVFVYEDRRPLADENGGTLNIFEAELPNTIFGDRDTSITHYSRTIPSSGGSFSFIIDTLFSPAAYPNPWPDPPLREQRNFFVLFQTPQGCFDQILPTTIGATLPVNLKSFTAVRNRTNVILKWETVSEEKNRGFDVQRFIGSGNWESVGFVSSKATDGYSASALNYDFNDINNISGITQYRLKLVDMDGKSSFSMIRSIRGEGQNGKTIVYPNPSGTGKVNVLFEDVNVTRDVFVIDMNGRTIKQWRGTNNNNIQIDNLNAGFYTLRIINKETGEQSVEKLIVNKR